MKTAIQFAVLGLGIGAVYALLAQGLVAINRASGVLNFAQGAMGMVSAFLFLELRTEKEWALLPSLIVSIGLMVILGALVYQVIMRPLQNASTLQRVIATLGVLLILQSIAVIIWGSNSRFATSELPNSSLDVGGVTIGEDRLWLLGIACLLTLVLWALSRYTTFGLATSAVAENRRAAAALAWSPAAIATVNWAIGAGLGAIAGILIAPLTGVQAASMTLLIIPAIAAALIGNFTSFPITLAGALAIGIAQSLAGNYIDQQGVPQSLPFFVLVIVLVLQGKSLPARGHVLERFAMLGSGQVRWGWAVGLTVALGALMLFVFSAGLLDAVTVSIITATLMLSVVVLTGYTGQLSLAQSALAGVGATLAARLVSDGGFPFELAVILGVLGAIVVGLFFAIPALRTRGVSLAAVTLGLGMAVDAIVFRNASMTGGIDGTPVGTQTLFGIDIGTVEHPDRYGVVALIAFVLVALAVASVRRGRVGRRLIAVRSNERAAAALGVSVIGAKLYSFALGAGIAGLAGVLLGFKSETVTFGSFVPLESILMVAYTVIGGVGFVIGPLFGSLFATGGLGTYIGDLIFSGITEYVALIGGVTLIMIMLTQPDGMAFAHIEIGHKIGGLFRRKPKEEAAPVDAAAVAARVAAAAEPHVVTPATLEAKGITVKFGGVTAVNDVSVKVEPGKIVGVIGPNGAGKTTLIDVITGFVTPVTGTVSVNGESVDKLGVAGRARKGVGRSFQALELFEDITVRDNLRAASDPRDRKALLTNLVAPMNTPLPPAAVAAIQEFDLMDDLDKLPTELPYGRRRLVAVARAVAMEPSVLLLDEPAAGLSEAETAELADLVRRLAANWGIAVLLIEHDMTFVMSVCDSLTVLEFGRQIASGSVDQVRSDPAVRKAYLGGEDGELADTVPAGALEASTTDEVTR